MRNKKTGIFGFFLATAISITGTVEAQTPETRDNISNRLEVTRAYTPKVGQALKLPVTPNMTDTVRLRPEIAYKITPTASPTTIATRPFAPASINTTLHEPYRKLYLRAGAGLPLQTTADLYFTPLVKADRTFGIFVNHRGSYSKITNALDVKTSATEMYNGVGLWGSRQTGRQSRYTLSGDLSYDNRRYLPYGVAYTDIPLLSTAPLPPATLVKRFAPVNPFSLGRLSGKIAFGDNFTDLSRFNFGVELDAGYAHGGLKQADINFRANIAYMINPGHGFSLELRERGAIDIEKREPTDAGPATTDIEAGPGRSASTLTLAPRYLVSVRKFALSLGFDANWMINNRFGQEHITVVPAFDGMWTLAGGRFVPFFSLSTEFSDGSYEALSRLNPYLTPATGTAATGWSHDFRLGFSGLAGGVFSYKLSTGVSYLDNYHVFEARQTIMVAPENTTSPQTFAASFSPAMFNVVSTDGGMFYAGVEFGVYNLGGFSARLAGNFNGLILGGLLAPPDTPAPDIPLYDASLELAYSHRDRFRFTAGAHLIGDREYRTRYIISDRGSLIGQTEYSTQHNTLGPVVDISVGAEVRVTPGFWAWVEGKNLANQRLYPYNHYRGLGANVMVGIKTVF